jgi:hypothetical protein
MGMWIPPNWIGIGLFSLLGFVNPGFWALGAGLELAYLYSLSTHPRFQRVVEAQRQAGIQRDWTGKLQELIGQLSVDDQKRYRTLERRCRTILQEQSTSAPTALAAQGDGLRRLLWIFLRLLLTRQSITKALGESNSAGEERTSLEERIGRLESKLKNQSLTEDLRKSLTAQVEILKQRQEKHREARDKLAFLEAELTRIQEQAELIREQAVLTTNPELVSQRIDQISETLGGTTQWIKEQQQIYGSVEDLLSEPPPLLVPSQKEVQ